MSGRNKRAAVTFLRLLQHLIRAHEEQLEELQSEWEWRRSGPQGFASELARHLGGDVDVRVNDSFSVTYRCLELRLDYRGNRTIVRVIAEEAMSRRRYAMSFCVEHGQKLKRHPCTHPQRPVRKMNDLPPIPTDFAKWMANPPEFTMAHTWLECPDCGATVG